MKYQISHFGTERDEEDVCLQLMTIQNTEFITVEHDPKFTRLYELLPTGSSL